MSRVVTHENPYARQPWTWHLLAGGPSDDEEIVAQGESHDTEADAKRAAAGAANAFLRLNDGKEEATNGD